MSKNNDPKRTIREKASWGSLAFLALLIIIPIGTAISLINITIWYQPEVRPVAAGTTGLPLGAFDPGLGGWGKFVIGALVFFFASIVETSLILVYGAFYINDPRYRQQSLGLAPGIVRIFILIIVVLTLVVFALLPTSWGDNKAVTFLFGILSTVVGFYYASSRDEATLQTPDIRLSIVEAAKIQTKPNFMLTGRMGTGYNTAFSSDSSEVVVFLIASDGKIVDKSDRVGIVDSSGAVEFDYTELSLGKPGFSTSYIVRVSRPDTLICDDRITVDLTQSATTPPQPPNNL